MKTRIIAYNQNKKEILDKTSKNIKNNIFRGSYIDSIRLDIEINSSKDIEKLENLIKLIKDEVFFIK